MSTVISVPACTKAHHAVLNISMQLKSEDGKERLDLKKKMLSFMQRHLSPPEKTVLSGPRALFWLREFVARSY